MSKRASATPSDGETSSNNGNDEVKRYKIAFETVRLPAVSNVNDIKNRTAVYQAAKLSQQLKYEQGKYKDLMRENERLRRRQETDEKCFYLIHRQFMEMQYHIRSAFRGETDVESNRENEEAINFPSLQEIIQLPPGEAEAKYEKTFKKCFNQLAEVIRARQRRSERYRNLMQQMSNSEDSKFVKDCPIFRDMSIQAQRHCDENVRLTQENARLQQEASEARMKAAKKEDENELLTAKNEELKKAISELEFTADKYRRQANKLENRMGSLMQELKSTENIVAAAPTTSNNQQPVFQNSPSPISGDTVKEIEAIRSERDEQIDVANKRLHEINELSQEVQRLLGEVATLQATTSHLPTDKIVNSEEYKQVEQYFNLAMKECERLAKDLEDVTVERDRLRDSWSKRVESIHAEHEANLLKMSKTNEDLNDELSRLKQDYDVLHTEFESSTAAVQNMDDSKNTDIKTICGAMKVQNHVLRQDVAKYKKKWKDAVNMVAKTQRELDVLQKKIDNSVVVSLDDAESTTQSSTSETNGLTNGSVDELRKLRHENETLKSEIKVLGKADRAERVRYFEKELQTRIGHALEEVERLKKEKETTEMMEKALSDELENIGSAVEELQEQNCQLLAKVNDLHDAKIKLLNEKIVTSAMSAKFQDRTTAQDVHNKTMQQQVRVNEFELQTLRLATQKSNEIIDHKTAENAQLTVQLEKNRKTIIELGNARDSFKARLEKAEAQYKTTQELLQKKASQVESCANKLRRVEEELSSLRKKYERLQKSEKYGSTDAVLYEELKQIKESQKCPSCKVNPKDTILLKCFHLFCETCIKLRYDTRQRKCPKCNCGFGANDFHRAYC
ncbi:unnamed protein product [Caenorhabditis bovis]|uniref:E3 ubiquitin protein ligase n=1 Tax=Caenorhabditis bovis TaxID=2654633 RepID=A0A8S1EQK2_9PELO|nr:unnamed protein product [Caenorhabditis bovis]